MQLSLVDPSRSGGLRSGRRHAFGLPGPGMGQQQPDPGPTIQSEPSENDVVDIRSAIQAAIEVLKTEAEVVVIELETVSPQTLRVEPSAPELIPVVGSLFSPRQLRTQTVLDARQLGVIVSRLETGGLAGYLTEAQKVELELIRNRLEAVTATAQTYDLEPISEGFVSEAEAHATTHTRAARELVNRAERALVAAEAAGVPVREPSEKGGAVAALLVVGLAAAAIWALLDA